METKFTRRSFVFGCACFGASGLLTGGVWAAAGPPEPRVYKLSHRRSARGLGALEPAFRFLESHDLGAMKPDRYPIDGERVYATISVDKTKAPAENRFEAHRKYIDLHYLVRGVEMIGSAPAAALREKQPYDAEKEGALYEVPARYRRLVLRPGDFTVFFPGQAHMPWCYPGRSEEIRKVVVKVIAES